MSVAPLGAQLPSFDAGLSSFRSKDFAAAHSILAAVVDGAPGNAEARHVLALALRELGLLSQAICHLAEVLRVQPLNAEAWSNYGAFLRELGRLDEALEALTAATSLNPSNSMAWNNLGTVHLDQSERAAAENCFEAALMVNPTNAEAHANLSRTFYESGKLQLAWQSSRTAVALSPTLAEAHNRVSFVQSSFGDLEGCLKSLRKAVQAEPSTNRISSNLFLRSLGSDELTAPDLLRDAENWGTRFLDATRLCEKTASAIQRVGFVSGDFRQHPVGFFLEPILKELSKDVEIFCYSTHLKSDSLTSKIQESTHHWRTISRKPAWEAATEIHHDDLDVLIDLSGHTGDNRLDVFSNCPAPLQVSWLGYSGTTGLPQMNAIIADSILIPVAHEAHYSERILRLPQSFLCFSPPETDSEVRLDNDPIVFGVFNNPAKFSETVYCLWSRILEQTPGSILLMKYHNLHDPWVQSRLRGRFEDHGIDPVRIRFASTVDYKEHLHTVARVHIALDTYPYSGATTTLDCLSAGTPVVTLVGDRYSSRMSASLMSSISRTDTICHDEDGYVRMAVEMAKNPEYLKKARTGIRESLLSSSLCDASLFATGFLEALSQLL